MKCKAQPESGPICPGFVPALLSLQPGALHPVSTQHTTAAADMQMDEMLLLKLSRGRNARGRPARARF